MNTVYSKKNHFFLVCCLAFSVLVYSSMTWAATITVNTTTDENNTDGDCSLREAVIAANSDTAVDACSAGSGNDTIDIPAGIYTLSITSSVDEDEGKKGDLDITDDVTLSGFTGAKATTIDADGIDRVIEISDSVSVTIKGLTITGGSINWPGGGGIFAWTLSNVKLEKVVVAGNLVSDGAGGGILSWGADMTITGSIVSGNRSSGPSTSGDGGGISVAGGNLTITGSTVSGNMADGLYARGAGIYAVGSCGFTITNSTIFGNYADSISNRGGGINSSCDLTMTNSTVSGNTAENDKGGGLYFEGANVQILNTTFAFNTAETGGGIYFSSGGTATVQNSILSDNTATHGPDCLGTINSLSYSIVNSTDDCTISSGSALTDNPRLRPLAGTGGLTKTHSLSIGSAAIDAGNPAGCSDASGNTLATDQRGKSRPADGDKDGTPVCDIGSVEFQK